jgi:hypothetical protein
MFFSAAEILDFSSTKNHFWGLWEFESLLPDEAKGAE